MCGLSANLTYDERALLANICLLQRPGVQYPLFSLLLPFLLSGYGCFRIQSMLIFGLPTSNSGSTVSRFLSLSRRSLACRCFARWNMELPTVRTDWKLLRVRKDFMERWEGLVDVDGGSVSSSLLS